MTRFPISKICCGTICSGDQRRIWFKLNEIGQSNPCCRGTAPGAAVLIVCRGRDGHLWPPAKSPRVERKSVRHLPIAAPGFGDQHVARQVVVVVQQHRRLDAALGRRNFAQGNISRHRLMVVQSNDSSLFLKRNVRLRGPNPFCSRTVRARYRTAPHTTRRADADWHKPGRIYWVPCRSRDEPVCPDNRPAHCRSRAGSQRAPVGRTASPPIVSCN